VYAADDAAALLEGTGLDKEEFARAIAGRFVSAFVRATKPVVKKEACCAKDDGSPCCV
jgi:hypothetical protein